MKEKFVITLILFVFMFFACDSVTKKKDEKNEISTVNTVEKRSISHWSKKTSREIDWSETKKYCDNLMEDGYSDWRLPTISELRTLVKNCPAVEIKGVCNVTDECPDSSCWNKVCLGCSRSLEGGYSNLGDIDWLWSTSEQSDNAGEIWILNFANGHISSAANYSSYYVRCVR